MTTGAVEAEVVDVGAAAGETSMTTSGSCFEVIYYSAASMAEKSQLPVLASY